MDLSSIDLNLLVILDALLREEHVTRAGERLGLSQSATSRALKKLRVLFKDELLIKGHQGMNLSAKALALRPQVTAALEQLEHLFALPTFDPASFSGTLVLSVGMWVPDTIVTDVLCALTCEAPRATIWFTSTHVPHALFDADLHAELKWSPSNDERNEHTFASDELVAVCPVHASPKHLVKDTKGWIGARHHVTMVPGTGHLCPQKPRQVYTCVEQLQRPGLVPEHHWRTHAHKWPGLKRVQSEMVPDTILVSGTISLSLTWMRAQVIQARGWVSQHIERSVRANVTH